MDGRMDGRTDGRRDGWMDGWRDAGLGDACMDGWRILCATSLPAWLSALLRIGIALDNLKHMHAFMHSGFCLCTRT